MNKREHFFNLILTLPEEKMLKQSTSFKVDKSGYILLNYVVDVDMDIKPKDMLTFNYGKLSLKVNITPYTILPQNCFVAGDELRIIGFVNEDECTARAVVTKSYYDMFRSYSLSKDKLAAMKTYAELSENSQASIAAQMSGERFSIAHTAASRISGMKELRFKFDMCRDTYTPQQQMDIEGIFDESKSLGASNKQKAERRLTYILNIDQTAACDSRLSKQEIINGLDKYLYKLDLVKEKIAESIVAAKYSKEKGMAILLVGSPGVGKTAIMKAIAAVVGRPFFIIPLGSSTSMVDVLGDAPHFDCSDCGEVVKNFYKAGTTATVVGLDEYDKSYDAAKEGGKVSKAFNDALSDEHFFKDAFLGTYINTSNTIFIASANFTETISENLLNRFTVIHIDDYSEEDKVTIAQDFILPGILSSYGISSEKITISRDTLAYITDNFCEDEGARDMKKHLKTLVDKVLSIWDASGIQEAFSLDKAFVKNSLETYVDENSAVILYRRSKDHYSDQVSAEIKELITKCRREDLLPQEREKYVKKLNYLVRLTPSGNAFSYFDANEFYSRVNKTHYGLEDVKKAIAQIFYISSINGKPLTSNRILLAGPPGIGKTSIVKSIADACKSEYAKVSLNGISDDRVIKGYSLTYTGADAGAIVKAAYRMKTSKGIIHLDEIDKMGYRNEVDAASTMVDLLDDSAEFTDSFLGIPVDFSSVLFIATANDISAVHPLLRDRFTIIHLDGYTEKQKGTIISDYIIPRVVTELCPEGIDLTFSKEARMLLTRKYCRSFGVRDADKIARKLVRDKLYSERNNLIKNTIITTADIESVLGKPAAQRGNFPIVCYPGLTRALAVTGDNCGMSFAVEAMIIPNETSLTITGLPRESTVDSVKLAVSYIKCHYPGTLADKGIHIHFGEGAVVKDGPSAGVAILMSLLSAVFNTAISKNISYTGEINGNGYIFNIGGTIAKIQAAEQSGCTRVYIPYGNYIELEQNAIEQFDIDIVPVKHISEVIDSVLPGLNKLPGESKK